MDDDPQQMPPALGRWFAATLAVALGVLLVQLYPYNIGPRDATGWLALTSTTFPALLGHIALFTPAGYCEARLGGRMLGGGRVTNSVLVLAVFDVVILAVIAESAQLWIAARTSNTLDLVAAAVGGAAGALIAQYRDA